METSMNRQPSELSPSQTLHCDLDYAFPDPGEYLDAYCGICHQKMAVERNVLGPTSSVEAMAVRLGQSSGRLHDRFYCEDREEPWHRQALAIHLEASNTASKRLADLLLDEAKEIVQTRRATKENIEDFL
jgi:hypothetical protein